MVDFTKYQQSLLPLSPSCAVASDVGVVARLASPVGIFSVAAEHQVAPAERMAVATVSFVQFGVASVPNFVLFVLRMSAVAQVFWRIVQLIAVEMAGHQTVRARPEEDQCDDLVDTHQALGSVALVQRDAGIALLVRPWLQDAFVGALSLYGENLAASIDAVVGEPGNVYPLRVRSVHGEKYTSANCEPNTQVREDVYLNG